MGTEGNGEESTIVCSHALHVLQSCFLTLHTDHWNCAVPKQSLEGAFFFRLSLLVLLLLPVRQEILVLVLVHL